VDAERRVRRDHREHGHVPAHQLAAARLDRASVLPLDGVAIDAALDADAMPGVIAGGIPFDHLDEPERDTLIGTFAP
jgi:hypothetical protein